MIGACRVGALLAALSCVVACSGARLVPSGGEPAKARERIQRPGPSSATCDPDSCAPMCAKTACGKPTDGCLERCRAVCGDGYFDDRDGPVIACVLATELDACGAMRGCCEDDYTSQLCFDAR